MTEEKEPILWLNRVPVKESTHKWIVEDANVKGRKAGTHAGLLLDDLVKEQCDGVPYDERGAMWAWENFQRKEYIKAQAKYVARQIIVSQNNGLYECLEELCDEIEFTPEQVITQVSNDPFSAAVIATNSETLLSKCTGWLAELMNDVGDEGIEQSVVCTLAEEAGFSESTLKRAKRLINKNTQTPSIKSIKPGVSWVWVVEQNGCS